MSPDPRTLPVRTWRPSGWAVGATTGAMVVLSAWTLVGERSSPGSHAAPLALDIAVGLAAVALVPALFRRPVPAAVAVAVLAALAPTATPASTAATYVVGRSRRLATAVVVAVVGSAAHVVSGLWRPVHGLALGWWVVLVLAAHAALLAVGALAQARSALLAGLTERARTAEADRDRHVAEAVAAERTRIAREMHDVLAHRLSLLATYAGALEYRPDASPERLAQAAGVVRSGVHQALEELRDVVGVLRDDPGDGVPPPSPDLDQLDGLVREARAAGGHVDVVVDLDGDPPGMLGRTVYRLVQEGLTNARKHAPAEPVRVRVTGRPGAGVEVTVTNPLRPVRADVPGSGTGLVGLTERVRIVGGRLEHGPDSAEFRLSAWLPWPP
ncbi:Signal transduction histidine kinase [Georgenia satyanarayanai]|uniref:histidine kinase n=1 Tax=Georgenia satyanarayanai TaxID=860221 RepID=A0A2Y9AVA1_9MICO|nr:histidine kinase [Georgenia satyanarayanai]PYF95947.1 signal transduction histidine kinase [Georgenia satyanarayanai]SSA47268.1 Signal transduction histidine kinase [Georgenia satyanarayanai]